MPRVVMAVEAFLQSLGPAHPSGDRRTTVVACLLFFLAFAFGWRDDTCSHLLLPDIEPDWQLGVLYLSEEFWDLLLTPATCIADLNSAFGGFRALNLLCARSLPSLRLSQLTFSPFWAPANAALRLRFDGCWITCRAPPRLPQRP